MKKIVVFYWAYAMCECVGIEHNTVFDYSDEKRNEIIDLVLKNKLNIMMYESDGYLAMWIDNNKFRQR